MITWKLEDSRLELLCLTNVATRELDCEKGTPGPGWSKVVRALNINLGNKFQALDFIFEDLGFSNHPDPPSTVQLYVLQ